MPESPDFSGIARFVLNLSGVALCVFQTSLALGALFGGILAIRKSFHISHSDLSETCLEGHYLI
ncbi:hypothetical protein [Rahnella sikkimica]|uniref:hypothetical protein n=1 Tax=Rahnella sikkimica TaxID=1805933 RepID=UPI001CFFBCAB|nr:hypothetical protein [Rahnella sikkimica]